MFCSNCAEKNPDDAQYCRKCGVKIPGSSDTDSQTKDANANQDEWAVAAVALVVFFIVAAFLFGL